MSRNPLLLIHETVSHNQKNNKKKHIIWIGIAALIVIGYLIAGNILFNGIKPKSIIEKGFQANLFAKENTEKSNRYSYWWRSMRRLLLDSTIFSIVLNDSELESLKNHKTSIPISFERSSLVRKFIYSLGEFPKRNRDFVDDVNSR